MKNILLITTGGTIASSEGGGGLVPCIDANQIMSYISEIGKKCCVTGLSIMCIDSTNMNPQRMVRIAEAIQENYDKYDGFVVTHGTDTLAYTAAALTYMLQNIKKPVVVTGAQIAIEEIDTDAKQNLSDAIWFAQEDISGVFVAFHGKIILGTHAVKVKTRSKDLFESINFPIIASVNQDKIIYYHELQLQADKIFQLKTRLCEDIFILKLYPGITVDIFDFIRVHYRGVIIESFGIGGIPSDIISKVGELIEAGIVAAVTTQCLWEGIDLNIYAVGQLLAGYKVIQGGNMTTEALTMKLMWALGNYDNVEEVKKFVETPFYEDKT